MADLRKDFWTLYDEFMGALPRQDLGVIDRILDDDWVYTDFVGTVRGKRDYFELVRQIVHDDSVAQLVELDVRPCAGGEVVLATGRYEVATPDTAGGTIQLHLRFTGLWQRSDGNWRYLAHHTSRVERPDWWQAAAEKERA